MSGQVWMTYMCSEQHDYCKNESAFVELIVVALYHFSVCYLLSRYLCYFLNEFSQYFEITKMSVGNIAIVIGPNLLWPVDDCLDPG